MIEIPSGTVTFLFTDIEGSTELAQHYPDALPALLARHHTILREAIQAHHGLVFKIIGDAFCAAFPAADDPLNATVAAQRVLQHEAWSPAPIKVRMGLNSGNAQPELDGDRVVEYIGYLTLTLAQRIMSTAYGGQVLISNATAELLRGNLPSDITLRDMGEHRLKGLTNLEHIWQLTAPDLTADFPPLHTLNVIPNNLPTQLTSFIGRAKEIAEVNALFNTARLVTLTGSGGTGKTRLSIEIGTQELPSFANGVWLIELAPLTDPAQIIPALAQAFGLQELPSTPLASLVTDYLRDKKLLLILDNCEHLIQACARLANDLLHHCAGLKLLTSSREALGIAGEMAYHTPSLAESESTRLFVERARAANPKFALTDSNRSAIHQVCLRLDGIPLAIELAAARTKLLSAEQIAARLDDLFRLLVGGSRTALPRQQTLRALIDWSYDLLSEEEKQLLRNASVFIGGWTLDALEAISDDSNAIEHLEGLVNKSLVVTEERNNEMRYFMLETIRQYAREKLFEAKQSSAARDRHFVYFNELSETVWDMISSANSVAIVNKSNDEVENFRAALEWGLVNHVEEAVRLAANFCAILRWMGKPAEGVALAQSAVERARALPPVEGSANTVRQKLIAWALFVQADAGIALGNILLSMQASKEAIAISRVTDDKKILGYSLLIYFNTTTFSHAPDGEAAAREGLDIFTHEVNDSFGLNMAYMCMATIAANKGDEVEKQKYFGKLKETTSEATDSFQAGLFLFSIGMIENTHGNYQAAKQIFEDGMNIFKRIRDTGFQQVMQSELGHIARHTGNLGEAKAIYHETIRSWQESGNRGAIANQLECFAFLAIADEEPQRAAKLFGAAEALRDKAQSPMTDNERVEYD